MTLKQTKEITMEEAPPYPTGVVPRMPVGNLQFGPTLNHAPNNVDNAFIPDGTVFKLKPTKKHSHYFKSVAGLDEIDVYRVLELFNVTNPAIAHAAKKLLVAGGRGAGKDIDKDIAEAIDTLVRWQTMRREDNV